MTKNQYYKSNKKCLKNIKYTGDMGLNWFITRVQGAQFNFQVFKFESVFLPGVFLPPEYFHHVHILVLQMKKLTSAINT